MSVCVLPFFFYCRGSSVTLTRNCLVLLSLCLAVVSVCVPTLNC